MNYSIFSTIIIEHWVVAETARLRKAPTDIPNLHTCLKSKKSIPQIMYMGNPLHNDKTADEISYKICTCAKLRECNDWITNNILDDLDHKSPDTCRVLLRIATDMLNKLYFNKIITKDENIYIHDCFVNNVLSLRDDLINEELPF